GRRNSCPHVTSDGTMSLPNRATAIRGPPQPSEISERSLDGWEKATAQAALIRRRVDSDRRQYRYEVLRRSMPLRVRLQPGREVVASVPDPRSWGEVSLTARPRAPRLRHGRAEVGEAAEQRAMGGPDYASW